MTSFYSSNFNFKDEAGYDKRVDEMVKIINDNNLRRAVFVWENKVVEVTKMKDDEFSIDPGPEDESDVMEFLGKQQCDECKTWHDTLTQVDLPRVRGTSGRTVDLCKKCTTDKLC
ncbi:hypothetical protein GZH47_33435 (plasmid) [Paenibacillus rhizovicinus]|uniref:Uncharacterized protein n=1 Tax=Paenibacillus rhizovicinus TaxID=2704463 RepID=A0A6C0PBA4_9BACL|nr:hypothetical protein [Paenibacillus rhizovicinus]QHW35798.1 hypothetical protein GZH47_33435 [Paenibacillus rhizovicinus]